MIKSEQEVEPRVIAVEGYDGAGKTTLTQGLLWALRSRGLQVIEVGRSATNSNDATESLTKIIKASDGGDAPLDPRADIFVRLARIHERINLILDAQADIVLLDRFIAYDLSRIDKRLIESYGGLFHEALGRIRLDLTVFLSAPFDLLWSRVVGRGSEMMSAKEMRGKEHNRSGYDELIGTMAQWATTNSVSEIDCSVDADRVLERSLHAIDAIDKN